ncbi:MAG: hypothetical protein IJZ70_05215 [Bacteroidales bacterium]|nr:hypothetical protein [Bacteroidales bacterium]
MWKFMKNYALEIYTVISMLLIVCVAIFMDELTVIQKFMVCLSFLYILHEWEEGHYPGGFIDLMTTNVLQRDVDTETKHGSRLITGVFLWVFSIVPFFYGEAIPIFVVATAVFCIFEGIVHVAGIKILRTGKPYTPGMVTAEIELVTGIALIVYLATNRLAQWYDYTFGPLVFIACFAMMQRTLMAMIGMRYRDMFAIVKKRFGK